MSRFLLPLRYVNYLLNPSNFAQAYFSTSVCCRRKDTLFKRRWLTSEKWQKERTEGKPWAPNVPMEHNEKHWTKANAFFGMYDFMDVLGNDVTMQPKLLCKGPSYMRGQRLNELQMLIKRRKTYGCRLHAEDLHSVNKRIKYLMKVFNRVKKKRHG